MTITQKKCTRCGFEKDFSEFHKSNKKKYGLSSWCKVCVSEYSKQHHIKNKDSVSAKQKQYYEDNKDKILVHQKQYYEDNKDTIAEQQKQYYEDNKDMIAERHKQHYKDNKDEILECQKQYEKDRRKNDVNYKLACNLRRRFRQAFNDNKKSGSAVDDLGCSVPELKLYLESKFQPGMTWENYGEWHLDHIIPLSSFSLTDREQFLKACHYTNLQPLWAEDNLKKGNKILP